MDRLVWPWWASVQVEGGNSWQSWRLTLIGWFWLVSENHSAASAAFREPLLCSPANSSNRSRLVHYVPNMDSGNGPISTFSRNFVLLWGPGKLLALAKQALPRFWYHAAFSPPGHAQHSTALLNERAPPQPFNRPPPLRAATP